MVRLNEAIFAISGVLIVGLVFSVSAMQRGKPEWRKLEFEKVALLPLTPIPRGPTWRETLYEGRQPVPGGPAMAVVRGQRIYVVDDVKRKLLECSMTGEVLRELDLPKDAPKSLSGVLNFCKDLLWVGFEGASYAFAIDLDDWRVVEERKWKGKGVVAGLFAMPDKTLYAIMPAKVINGVHVIWQLIKIAPDGKQKGQIVEGWRPALVDTEGNIYWVNRPHPKDAFSHPKIMIACGRFGEEPKMMEELHRQKFKAYLASWVYTGPIVGVTKDGVLGRSIFARKDWLACLFLRFGRDGQVKVIGEEPTFMGPIRSLDLPDWWVCEGQIYAIMREHVGEHARFWLVRLKL